MHALSDCDAGVEEALFSLLRRRFCRSFAPGRVHGVLLVYVFPSPGSYYYYADAIA